MTGLFSGSGRSRRGVIRDNAAQGKRGEDRVRKDYEFAGYDVQRTGRGHDFKVSRKNWLTGKKDTKYVEVKTGSSELSPLQKRKKRSMGKKYEVVRREAGPLGYISGPRTFGELTGGSERAGKKAGIGLWSGGKASRKGGGSSRRGSGGGSGISLWGSGGSSGGTSRRKSGGRRPDSLKSKLWGSGGGSGGSSRRKSGGGRPGGGSGGSLWGRGKVTVGRRRPRKLSL